MTSVDMDFFMLKDIHTKEDALNVNSNKTLISAQHYTHVTFQDQDSLYGKNN